LKTVVEVAWQDIQLSKRIGGSDRIDVLLL